ncbi:MAG TPA: helix-turn-helix domain-containing protein [Thermomicrobiaceae bacterium]|nr:helix-turn-helix domain-containing protein [Thermomicrobiaceae bacterium]
MASGKLLGISAVARELGVAPNTLRRWCDQGRVPCLKTPTGYRRFTRGMVEEIKRTMGYAEQQPPDGAMQAA